MALRFILDGYNIIKSDEGGVFAAATLEQQRTKLLDWLCHCHPQGSSHNTVMVVFDGKAEHPYWSDTYSEQMYHGIIVRYSEGVKADDIIEAMASQDQLPAEIVVVTNDKGIHRRLGGTGARWISVAAFMAKAVKHQQPSSGGQPMDNTEGIDNNEITEEMKTKWLK
jgi:predicted RNA-binding protein with PIN domain